MITTQLDHFNFTSYLMNDNGIDGDLIAGDDIFFWLFRLKRTWESEVQILLSRH